MTNELVWDTIPSQRTTKKEQFTTPVVTIAALVKEGVGRKFTFNKASQELLNIEGESRVSFGFTPDGHHIYIRKASGTAGFQLTKTCTFSDKKTFEFISKNLELDNSVENHFDIVPAPMEGNVYELILRTPMTEMAEGFSKSADIIEFAKTELGEITEEVTHTPFAGGIIDETVEETTETLDLTEHVAKDEASAITASTEETDEWS